MLELLALGFFPSKACQILLAYRPKTTLKGWLLWCAILMLVSFSFSIIIFFHKFSYMKTPGKYSYLSVKHSIVNSCWEKPVCRENLVPCVSTSSCHYQLNLIPCLNLIKLWIPWFHSLVLMTTVNWVAWDDEQLVELMLLNFILSWRALSTLEACCKYGYDAQLWFVVIQILPSKNEKNSCHTSCLEEIDFVLSFGSLNV